MDLIGESFGRFTVIASSDEHAKNKHRLYRCQCICGEIELLADDVLKLKRFGKECNHMMRGIRLDAITPDRIKTVLSKVNAKSDIFDAIRKERLSANTFFLALRKDPDLNTFYLEQRKLRIEELLETCVTEVDDATSKLELEKAKIKLTHYQWKAERLIPEAYANKMQIDVNKTVDIRGALEEAKERAGIIEATYRAVVTEEIAKELPKLGAPNPELQTPSSEPLPADSSEIDFAEMYQRSLGPSAEDLLG